MFYKTQTGSVLASHAPVSNWTSSDPKGNQRSLQALILLPHVSEERGWDLSEALQWAPYKHYTCQNICTPFVVPSIPLNALPLWTLKTPGVSICKMLYFPLNLSPLLESE